VTSDANNTGSQQRQFAFIDESGSPYFDVNRPEEGYVVVSTLVTERDLATARLIVPRRADGELIKSSGPDATDELAAEFLARLFRETGVQIGLVTAALSDPGNTQRMQRMKAGIDTSPFPRRSRPSIADAIRMQASLAALGLSMMSPHADPSRRQIRIVFDRGSERPAFMSKVQEFMRSPKAGAPLIVDDVQWLSRSQEPLIMISDWVAGSVRRDIQKGDIPLTRQVLALAKREGRLHDKEGFTAYLPKES
jgi:hypothetical protein